MISVDTEAANLALGHLGISKTIENLETERSNEANVCRRFLPQVIEETQRDYPWSFNTVIDDLVLVESNPNDEWAYSYRYPSDCERFSRILSGMRNDSRQSRVSYKIVKDSNGRLILTDKQDAQGEWNELVDEPSSWPADYVAAVALLLAFYIGPSLTAGDPFKLGERALKIYLAFVSKAKATNENEQQNDENPDSEFIRNRS